MGGCDKIRGVVRANLEIDLLREQSRYTMFEASGAGIDHLIIVATHLPDRRSDSDSGVRHEVIRDIVADIQRCESERNPAGTVVIGDFNANPYDRELVAPDAFNAVLFKDIIRQNKSRTWNCKERSYLYNPVIDRLSEEGKMYGSYYYAKSSCSPYWNCFDQALVSRSLVDYIGEFRYLREIGGTSLMSEVRPSTKISDHLPLFVSIEGGRA